MHNNFSGNISDQLSELTNLEFLDLSSNRLYGEIPASLAKLRFLKKFSVANNKRQGAIPLGTQLQSFDASAYVGNLALCGPPLPNECADITRKERDKEVLHEENGIAIPWHHISVVLGFITGFWGICGPIAFNSNWRFVYFRFLDNVKDRIYVALAVSWRRLHRRRL
ncbi:Tyrosine-sulfated glycopeptide receptor 1 [Morella rubra]|uniref:Tyrosine-sulfated glycopeptide receptor 1 n=1 Tax=Morella rubra TaxID=262757 RepID=A0A6A1WNZ9_9ROSI|nr:Tyrosine-sulfated glycopeptide receptor 1 [Morella rubra]